VEQKDKSLGVSRTEFVARSLLGEVVDPSFLVFPIFVSDGEDPAFLGTGFFCWTEGVIITAKHVARYVFDSPDKSSLAMAAVHRFENKYAFRNFRRLFNNDSDVCVVFLDQPTHVVTGQMLPNHALVIDRGLPAIGEKIFSYSYPQTTVIADTKKIHIRPNFYEGKVVQVFPRGRDRTMLVGPCFQTDMHIHGGASGGPVFNENGHVIGVNSTSFSSDTSISFVSSIECCMPLMLDGIEYRGAERKISFESFINGGLAQFD
jgi:hypothetical protein